MLMLYFALVDSEADQLRFSDIYSNYQKQMLLVEKVLAGLAQAGFTAEPEETAEAQAEPQDSAEETAGQYA